MLAKGGNGVRGLISEMLETNKRLPKKQRAVLQFLQENPVAAGSLSVEQLAAQLGINPSTIVRAAKSLGYEGYGELKRDLRYIYLHDLNPLDLHEDHQARVSDRHLVRAQLQADLQNLADLNNTVDLSVIEAFATEIHKARRILVVSAGSYAAVGHVLSHQLRFIGVDIALEIRGGAFLAHSLALLRPGDFVVGITFWRGQREVAEAMEWARSQGITVGVITDNRHSRLARSANLVLTAPSESTSYYQSMTAGMALTYGIINCVWLKDPAKAEQAAKLAQSLYLEFHVTTDA